ncbi:MAG: rRNA pseudouridine synthase [Anaerolineae bacterium]|nr:rRNA pseudouridine synthase [Anaerolineae bacterium]
MEKERLQKILAAAGFGSRRSCETLIEAGRVRIDEQVAKLGDQADPYAQRITVDGAPIPRPQSRVYVMLNKPRGVITSTDDPHGRKTVLDLVALPRPKRGDPPRLYPVGRLDWDSEGLLLLTNDGGMTQRLTHPSYEHPRSYSVLVAGEPAADVMQRWQRGIMLDGRMTRFDTVTITEQARGETWLRVTVHEGRKHLVRRMVAALGFPAIRLIRVSMGPLQLGTLASGKWRYLSEPEVRLLRREGAATDLPQVRVRQSARPSGPRRLQAGRSEVDRSDKARPSSRPSSARRKRDSPSHDAPSHGRTSDDRAPRSRDGGRGTPGRRRGPR